MDFTKLSQKEKLEFLKSSYHSSQGYWEQAYPEAILTFGKEKKLSDELVEIIQDSDLKDLESLVESLAAAVHSINISVDERIDALAKRVSELSEKQGRGSGLVSHGKTSLPPEIEQLMKRVETLEKPRVEVTVPSEPGAISLVVAQPKVGFFGWLKSLFT